MGHIVVPLPCLQLTLLFSKCRGSEWVRAEGRGGWDRAGVGEQRRQGVGEEEEEEEGRRGRRGGEEEEEEEEEKVSGVIGE